MICSCLKAKFPYGKLLSTGDLVVHFYDPDHNPISPYSTQFQVFDHSRLLAEGDLVQDQTGIYHVPLDLSYFPPGDYTLLVSFKEFFDSLITTSEHEFEVTVPAPQNSIVQKYGWW